MKVYCAFTTGPTRQDVLAAKAAVPVSLPWILPVTRTIDRNLSAGLRHRPYGRAHPLVAVSGSAAGLPEETTMAKIMSWRTMDTSGMEGRQRQQYEDLKETFALPKELRHTRTAVTVADHNAAFLQRLRHGDDEEVSAPMADFSITGDVRLNSDPAEQSVNKWTVAAGQMIADFAKKAADALMSVVKSGLSYNRDMESYLTNFKVMLGDEQLAAEKLEEIRKMAASTPFTLSDRLRAPDPAAIRHCGRRHHQRAADAGRYLSGQRGQDADPCPGLWQDVQRQEGHAGKREHDDRRGLQPAQSDLRGHR